MIIAATPPSKPDIPPPIREREVETPVELPDPNRDAPKPENDEPADSGDLHDEDAARETTKD